jgi:hypothetical protein
VHLLIYCRWPRNQTFIFSPVTGHFKTSQPGVWPLGHNSKAAYRDYPTDADQDWLHKAAKDVAKFWRNKRERHTRPISANVLG